MRFARGFGEFKQTTKMILDFFELVKLGLRLDSLGGTFRPDEIEDVLNLCSHDSRYHLVTLIGDGLLLNRYEPGGTAYVLAEGDASPDYAVSIAVMGQWIWGGNKAHFNHDAG